METREKIALKDKIKYALAFILAWLMIVDIAKNNIVQSDLQDIGQRLKHIEQDGHRTDSCIINLYQRVNEVMYDQVWIRRDIKQLQKKGE